MTKRFPDTFRAGYGRHQVGLSLIELMIAMLLGVILTMGVVQIFIGSGQTYRMNDSISRNQEGGRFALDFMQRELRGAGQIGCSGSIQNWMNLASPAYVPHLLSGDNGVVGWEFAGTGLGNAYPITTLVPGGTGWSNGLVQAVPAALAGLVVPGNDILVVNRADRIAATPTAVAGTTISTNPASPGVPASAIVLAVTGSCDGADMFQKSNALASNGITKNVGGAPGNVALPLFPEFRYTHTPQSTLYLYTSTAYYIGRGINHEPGLYRLRLDPVGGVPEEIVDGVENMQVLYGLSATDDPLVASQYVTAGGVPNWNRVASVRLSLLLRSETEVVDVSADAALSFNLTGTRIQPIADRRVRLASTTTVSLRSQIK